VQLLADLEEAEGAVSATAVEPRGTLRLTCGVTFGARHLAGAIADFQALHPQVRFDIELSDRPVDLVDEGLDLAIRIGDIGSQALIGRRIGVAQIVCCAAPAYLATHAAPRTPDDLRRHLCLTYEYSTEGNVWRFTDREARGHEVKVIGHAHANNGAMLAALAVEGRGITVAPDFIVADDVRACLGTTVFDTIVPRNVRLSEAPSHGLPALIYDLKCPGSEAYVRLARELIGRLPQLAVAA